MLILQPDSHQKYFLISSVLPLHCFVMLEDGIENGCCIRSRTENVRAMNPMFPDNLAAK